MGDIKRIGLRSDDARRRNAEVLRIWADRLERGEVHGLLFAVLHGDDKMAHAIVEDFAEVGPVHLLGLAHTLAVILGRDVSDRMCDTQTTD